MAKKGSPLTMRSNVRTLSIKVYAEQLAPLGLRPGSPPADIKAALEGRIPTIDKSRYFILAIVHDRDPATDDIWEPSTEKPHVHIIVQVKGESPAKLHTIMELLGVEYRRGRILAEIKADKPPEDNLPVGYAWVQKEDCPGVWQKKEPNDSKLWENHGVETLGRNFANMAVYLTHDTQAAIDDGKERYGLGELISNCTIEEIKNIRAGYTSGRAGHGKVDIEEQRQLDETAYNLGYNLDSFNRWWGSLTYDQRKMRSMRTTLLEHYETGVEARLEVGRYLKRASVFIQGAPNTGKTYYFLDKPNTLIVDGVKSGGTDKLQIHHKTLVIDDATLSDPLTMADCKVGEAYKRGSNNPYWAGDLLVVLANDDFDTWLARCGDFSPEQKKAILSRFYVCRIEDTQLTIISPATRGTNAQRMEIADRFQEFREDFERSLAEYAAIKTTGSSFDVLAYLSRDKDLPFS